MNIKELIKAAKDNYLMTYIANHRNEISKEDFSAITTVLLDVMYSKCASNEDEQEMCKELAYELRNEFIY